MPCPKRVARRLLLFIGVVIALLTLYCRVILPETAACPGSAYLASKTTTAEALARSRHVIVTLVISIDDQLCQRIRNISDALPDNGTAEIVVFHSEFPGKETTQALLASTSRPIKLVHADPILAEFPTGFDPYFEEPNWAKRSKWGYQQMIKFFYRDMFRLPMFADVKYIMRFDDDSCFPSGLPDVFQMMNDTGAVYYANLVAEDEPLFVTETLVETAREYVASNGLTPVDEEYWQSFFRPDGGVRTYYNNFEVCDLDFFFRSDVQKMTDWIVDTYGIHRHRWGDGPLRYMTLALFATREQVLLRDFPYEHPCST